DAIFSVTRDSIIDSWNRGAGRLYGYSAAEAIGQAITMLIPPDRAGETATIFQKAWRGERVNGYETQRRAKDGKLVDISLTLSPIKDANGNFVGLSVIGRDIRDRKRGEVERGRLVYQLGERIKELTAMYGVAHWLQMEEPSTLALLQEITSL